MAGQRQEGPISFVFRSYYTTGYFCEKDRLLEIAEREDGEFVRGICEAAKKERICIVAGFAERGRLE